MPADVPLGSVSANPVEFRLYTPANRTGAGMVWIHGGGMVIGSPQQTDTLCGEIAHELGITIMSNRP